VSKSASFATDTNRFVLKIIFYKSIHIYFSINIFIAKTSQSCILETVSLSQTTSLTKPEGVSVQCSRLVGWIGCILISGLARSWTGGINILCSKTWEHYSLISVIYMIILGYCGTVCGILQFGKAHCTSFQGTSFVCLS
jgi:hypothetical protein